jgi:MFS transporter, PPP family, 3-phenylpropionic acid transporter
MPALRAIYVAMGIAIAAFLPFTSVLLASRGFGAGEIGLVAAGQSLAYLLAVPAWGHLGDVVIGRRRALVFSALGGAAVVAAAGLPLPGILFAALVIAFSSLQAAWPALSDALAINTVRGDARAYGRVRVLASLSFALGTAVAGFVFDALGYEPAFYLCAAASLAIAAAATLVPDVPRADLRAIAGGRGRGRGGSFGVALRVEPRLWAILGVASICYLAMSAGGTFMPLRVVALGGRPSDVALAWAVGALTEVPMMLLGGRVVAWIGIRGLVAGSALIYGACLAGIGLAPSVGVIFAVRSVSGLAFAGLAIGMVLSISALLPPRLQATGQGLYQVVSFGIAGVVANALGGVLFGVLPAAWFFGGAGLLCAIGGILALAAFAPVPASRSPEARTADAVAEVAADRVAEVAADRVAEVAADAVADVAPRP